MTKYRFDEIAINSTQKKKPTEEDKVYYIGLEHIDPGCFDVVRWGSDVAPTGDKLLMQKGDVLFGKRRAYQRKVAIAPFDGIFSAHGMVLRPNLKVIDANYFPFFISSDKFMDTAVRISVGGLSPTINWKDLARQEFELPSLDEQKVLAYKLWAAYRLKEAYKKLLVATDEIVKSQFIEMFDFNDLSLTSPANDFSKYCKDDTSSATKIVAGDYLSKGIYPIYDQSKDNTIAGYTNKKEGLCDNVPAVLFGDHSRVIKYINTPFFIGADGVKIIRPKINEIIPEFLYYDLKYHTIPNTGYNRHFKFVKMLKLTKASMEKQNEFLLIARQADKSKFGDFKSQFIEMFGTVENNTHNFPIMTIGEFAYCFAGATPSTSHPEYWENGRIRWMSSGEVHKGHVEDTDSRITELGYKSASTRMVPIHSIVIAIAGQGKTRGTVAITEVDLCTNQSLCAIVPDERVNYSYLYHNLQGRYLELRGLSGDVNGRGGLNLKIIQKIPVILPPIEKQQQFASIAQQADKSKSVIQKALVYLNDIQSDELKEIA